MAVERLTSLRPAFFDANGDPYNGARLFFYAAGTTTKQNTFSDSAGAVPNTNPIVLNARGEPNVSIYVTVGVSYDIGLAAPGSDDPPSSFIWSELSVIQSDALRTDLASSDTAKGSSLITHMPKGSGAVAISVRDALELEEVSIFKYMSEVQRNDVQGFVGSTDVSSAIQKAHDYADGKRLITGWGRARLLTAIAGTSPMKGIGGGIFNGLGLTFDWRGIGNRIFNFATYDQGWEFSNFRIDYSNVFSDLIAMYFPGGAVGEKFRMIEFIGYTSGSGFGRTYAANQDCMVFETDGVSNNATQNDFDMVYVRNSTRGITFNDGGGIGDGGGNTFKNMFGWCKEHNIKSTGPSIVIIGGDFNCEEGGFNFIQSGSYAAGWVYEGVQATQSKNADYIIRADTAGSFDLFNWTGGNIASNEGGGAQLLSSAGNGTHVFRYTISGETSSTGPAVQTDNVYVGQGVYSQNRNIADGIWTTPSFSAGDYTGQGAMTVTVIAGNVADFKYTFYGKTMTVKFSIAGISIGGTPAGAIRITPPGGVTIASYSSNPCTVKDNGTWGIGTVEVVSGQPYIYIYKDAAGNNWSASASNTSFKGELSFEIA